MPVTSTVAIKSLSLDLTNFRTLHQKTEADALRAIASVRLNWFHALMESLLEDGYHPTENIILLKAGKKLIVKEGNRRVAAIKLMLGLIPDHELVIPANIQSKIDGASKEWKKQISQVPCVTYEPEDAPTVDRLVTLLHGKDERAGRNHWTAVARARHNRDMKKASEPGLDLLEKYLENGRNLADNQKQLWAGDYRLTILDDVLKRLHPRLGLASAKEISGHFLKSKYRDALEKLLHAIGEGTFKTKDARGGQDELVTKFGFPADSIAGGPTPTSGSPTTSSTSAGSSRSSTTGSGGTSATGGATNPKPAAGKPGRPTAYAITDPRSVVQVLKKFKPKGPNREKVVALKDECCLLSLEEGGHPYSFCFLLRSMFEISAKAYCVDHVSDPIGPKAVKADGNDRFLADVLRDVNTHLTKNNTDKAAVRRLHGAISDLNTPEGILSVTSMNQLVHHPTFSLTGQHICTVFHNVFPLLQAMNA